MVAEAFPTLLGSDFPRIGADFDPAPLIEVRKDAKALGISLMPWQEYSLGIAEARNSDGSFLFPEFAAVVARQNGKSTMLAPLIRYRMRTGRRILHTAQDRITPRRLFGRVAESFPKGEARIRESNGQEEIVHPSGGRYKIVAPKPRSVRGYDVDDLILDEIREQEDWELTNAAKPTVTASVNPQILYLSNAGEESSVVLNDLQVRWENDPSLVYLEWSADPELDPGDHRGWAQANPALGRRFPLSRLQSFYNSYRESGNLAAWETEHLCRSVITMAPRLVTPADWAGARKALESPVRPYLALSTDPDGRRASASLSWAHGDGSVGTLLLADVEGDPKVDIDRFAVDLKASADKAGVIGVGFDPATDAHLARYFPEAQPISGQVFQNAVERWVTDIHTGRLRWNFADQIASDLHYAARKDLGKAAFTVERADPRRPITAVLAAIRSHWLASEPNQGAPSVW
jgi:hypothetical protein